MLNERDNIQTNDGAPHPEVFKSVYERLGGQVLSYQTSSETNLLEVQVHSYIDPDGDVRFKGLIRGGTAAILKGTHTNGRPTEDIALKLSSDEAPLDYWHYYFGANLAEIKDNQEEIVGYAIDLNRIPYPGDPNSPVLEDNDVALRFASREAPILHRLKHPNICQLVGDHLLLFPHVYERNGLHSNYAPSYPMELVEGEPLDNINSLVEPEYRDIYFKEFANVADALDHANRAHNILHRDLKPGNLLWDTNSKTIKIVDFGMALVSDHTRAEREEIFGTYPYMAPERFVGSLNFGSMKLGYINRNIELGFLEADESKFTTATEQIEYAATCSASFCAAGLENLVSPRDLKKLSFFDNYAALSDEQKREVNNAWDKLIDKNQLVGFDAKFVNLPNHNSIEQLNILKHMFIAFSKEPTTRFMSNKLFAGLLSNMLIKNGWEDRPIPYTLAYELSDYAYNVRFGETYRYEPGINKGTPYTDARKAMFIKLMKSNPSKILDYLLPSVQPNELGGEARAQILRQLGRNKEEIAHFDELEDDAKKASIILDMLESSFNGRRRFPKHSIHVVNKKKS